jgi:hypothetical protein
MTPNQALADGRAKSRAPLKQRVGHLLGIWLNSHKGLFLWKEKSLKAKQLNGSDKSAP